MTSVNSSLRHHSQYQQLQPPVYHQSQGSSSGSSSNSRLPSHYKPAARPLVVQPARPSPSNGKKTLNNNNNNNNYDASSNYAQPIKGGLLRSSSTLPYSNDVTNGHRNNVNGSVPSNANRNPFQKVIFF